MIKIREVKSRHDRKLFVEFPNILYKDSEYYVPALAMSEYAVFKKNYFYNENCDSKFFLAFDENNKVVGRISAINQKAANEKWKQKRIRFTRFDSIDSQEVANALLGACESWAKSLGMEEVVGPLGYSDLEREGLLVEGFDYLSTFEEQYNAPYYQKLIENYGYQKEVGWTERRLFPPFEPSEKLEHLSSMMMKKYHLRLANEKKFKVFVKKYIDDFFYILDETYEDIYGTVPFTDSMKKDMMTNFNLILNPDYVTVVLDENDKPVGFGLCFPSFSHALLHTGGHLRPWNIPKIIHEIKHPKIIDFGLIGISKEYRMKGIASALLVETMKMLKRKNIEYVETNLNLEDNFAITNQWKNFNGDVHKRRNAYLKKLK